MPLVQSVDTRRLLAQSNVPQRSKRSKRRSNPASVEQSVGRGFLRSQLVGRIVALSQAPTHSMVRTIYAPQAARRTRWFTFLSMCTDRWYPCQEHQIGHHTQLMPSLFYFSSYNAQLCNRPKEKARNASLMELSATFPAQNRVTRQTGFCPGAKRATLAVPELWALLSKIKTSKTSVKNHVEKCTTHQRAGHF